MGGEWSILKCDDMVAGLYAGDTLTNRLDDTGALVTENDGECALRVFTGESVRIWRTSVYVLRAISHPAVSTTRPNISILYQKLGWCVSTRKNAPVWQTPV